MVYAAQPVTKVVLLALVTVLYLAVSVQPSEGKTTIIRIKKPKIYASPKHIESLAKLTEGLYASNFAYGDVVPSYLLSKRVGRQTIIRSKDKKKKKIRVIKYGGMKNYAKKYRTWAPTKDILNTRNTLVMDTPKPNKRRRPVVPPSGVEEDFAPAAATPGKRRRVRPNLRNPYPPPKPDDILYDEYEGEEFFPEETKRQEFDYDGEGAHREPTKKKRKRKPGGKRRKPIKFEEPKFQFEDEKPSFPADFQSSDGSGIGGSVSYTNFVQHLPGNSGRDTDYEYVESEEDARYNERRKQKKRRQKKPTVRPDEFRQPVEYDEDPFPGRYPQEETFERYPPYYANRDAVTSADRSPSKVKFNKPHFEPTPTPLYGEGHIEQSTRYRYVPRPSTPTYQPEYHTEPDYRGYRETPKPYAPPPPPDHYPRPTPSLNTEYGPPYQGGERFAPSDESYNRPYRDYSSQQNTGFNVPVSSPNSFNPYPKNQVNQVRYSPPVTSFSGPAVNSAPSGSSYQNPTFSGSPSYTVPEYPSQPRPQPPAFDNTESFYDFTHNANANSHPSKGIDVDFFSRYNNRQGSDKTDTESDFIAKHQNLYNNGITGVPIQGDGFGKLKDYDIGYGEYQFDENSSS